MCTNCLVNQYDKCGFVKWGESCVKCQTGRRSMCTFKITPAQRTTARELLAAATKNCMQGRYSFYPACCIY